MTNREQATYDLIIANSKKNLITTKLDIYTNYPSTKYKDGYVWNYNPTSHDECSEVWQDIDSINKQCQEIIIPHRGHYWVGTKEEAKRYASNYFASKCSPALKRYWTMIRKINEDGQMDIFLEEIIKSCFEENN